MHSNGQFVVSVYEPNLSAEAELRAEIEAQKTMFNLQKVKKEIWI